MRIISCNRAHLRWNYSIDHKVVRIFDARRNPKSLNTAGLSNKDIFYLNEYFHQFRFTQNNFHLFYCIILSRIENHILIVNILICMYPCFNGISAFLFCLVLFTNCEFVEIVWYILATFRFDRELQWNKMFFSSGMVQGGRLYCCPSESQRQMRAIMRLLSPGQFITG